MISIMARGWPGGSPVTALAAPQEDTPRLKRLRPLQKEIAPYRPMR